MSTKRIILSLPGHSPEDVPAGSLQLIGAKTIAIEGEGIDASDDHYTMAELYEHQYRLWITTCRIYQDLCQSIGDDPEIWRSRADHEGFSLNYFLLGLGIAPLQQITYTLPNRLWDECAFAPELKKAPKYDGHSSDDVLMRLKTYFG